MSNNYSNKLKDPRWQRKRLEVMQRDDFSCTHCGSKTDTLHVHHDQYKGNPWDVSIDDLKTLCCYCHEAVEFCKTNNINYKRIKRFERYGNIIFIINCTTDIGLEGICSLNYSSGKLDYTLCFLSKSFLELLIENVNNIN